jgi:hypothetical protein
VAGRKKTRFIVEMHSPEELPMAKNAGLLLDWTADMDYAAYYLKEHVQLTAPEQVAHRGRCHVLLQPSGWPYPEGLRDIAQGQPIG